MEWLVNNEDEGNSLRSECRMLEQMVCPNYNFCAIKFGGESCTSKSCGVYVS